MTTPKKSSFQRNLERVYGLPFEVFYPEVRERCVTPERAAAELDCSITTVRNYDEWMDEFQQAQSPALAVA